MTSVLAEPTKRGRARLLRLGGWVALAALLVAAARMLDWSRTVDTIRGAQPAWLVLALAANAVILVLWAAFWRALSPQGEATRFRVMLAITPVASALMNTVPFFAGHASSVMWLVTRSGLSRPGALAVVALDQLGEGIAKLTIFVAVALLAPVPSWMRTGILATAGAVALLLAVLVVLAHRQGSSAPPESTAAGTGWRAFFARWAHGLDVLRSWRRAAYALACVLGMKSAEALAILAVQRSLGIQLPIPDTLLVLAAVLLGSMLPLSPGNVGTYEAGVFLAYRHLGVAPEQAAVLALAQHACYIVPAVVPGYVLLARRARSAIASS